MIRFMSQGKSRIMWIVFSLCLTGIALAQSPPTVRWGRQIVTPTKDSIFRSMVTDSNDGIYLAVSRESIEASGPKTKRRYLLKYNQHGEAVWTKLLGARDVGEPLHIDVDDLAADDKGNIYLFGFTESKLGEKHHGGYDAFFALLFTFLTLFVASMALGAILTGVMRRRFSKDEWQTLLRDTTALWDGPWWRRRRHDRSER